MSADIRNHGVELWQCQKCNSTDLRVTIKTWASLTQHGRGDFETDANTDAAHEWDENSQMECVSCGFVATSDEFEAVDVAGEHTGDLTKHVVITVAGGVAEALVVPEGVEVEIRDYDTQGCDEGDLETDEMGKHTSDRITGPIPAGIPGSGKERRATPRLAGHRVAERCKAHVTANGTVTRGPTYDCPREPTRSGKDRRDGTRKEAATTG